LDVHEALDAWQAQYGGQPPVGFMLRFSHESVWTRLHYAPADKPAAAHADASGVAANLDSVAGALFTGSTVLVMAILAPSTGIPAELAEIGAVEMPLPASWIEALHDYLTEAGRARVAAATLSWQRGCLDRLMLAVARLRIARPAIFSPATGDAFCPFDLGADIFVWGKERRSRLDERFRDWVPPQGAPGGRPPGGTRQAFAGRG
jgi:hypothetical protein